jgi:hypothetical protein
VACDSHEWDRHRATDQQSVRAVQEVPNDPDLFGDLGAGHHGHQRAGGILADSLEYVDFSLHQPSRSARK